jgi:excisionase family DNA binding protein
MASTKPQSEPPEPLMTAAEVAEWLNVSASAVYDLCSAGELNHFRIGTGKKKTVRIARADVEDYLERSRAMPPVVVEPTRRTPRSKVEVGYAMLRKYGYNG